MQRRAAKQLTNYAQAYDYALVRLSYRDYSEKDLERLLRQHACPQEVISEVLAKLKEYSILNDARYNRGKRSQRFRSQRQCPGVHAGGGGHQPHLER